MVTKTRKIYTPKYIFLTAGGRYNVMPEVRRMDMSGWGQKVFVNSRSGHSVANWLSKIAHHQNATSPYTAVFNNVRVWRDPYAYRHDIGTHLVGSKRSFVCEIQQRYFPYPTYGGTLAPYNSNAEDRAEASERARAGCFEKEANRQVQMNAQVFLGELDETVSMLYAPLKAVKNHTWASLRELAKKMAKAEKKGKYLSMKQLNNWFLGYTFGVAPFIGDVESAAEALASAIMHEKFAKCQGSSGDIQRGFPRSFWYSNDPFTVQVEDTYTLTTKARARSQIRLTLDGRQEVSDRLLVALNLDGRQVLANFAPTMWELLPFSFLYDYFGNFGNVIQSRWAIRPDVVWQSLTIKESAQTIRNVWIHGTFPPGSSANGTQWKSHRNDVRPGLYSFETVRIQRYDTMAPLSFHFELPTNKQKLNTASLITALSGAAEFADRLLKRHFHR